jgi:hypothetical protein
MVTDCPLHNVDTEETIELAGTEVSRTVTVTDLQGVLLQVPSALT